MAEEKKDDKKDGGGDKVKKASSSFGFIVVVIIAVIVVNGWGKNKNVPVETSTSQVETSQQVITNESLPFTRLLTTPNGSKVAVRVADTFQTRELGLSGFSHLPDNEGMLFVFNGPGTYPFWMKDMKFPLDIIWAQTISPGQLQVVSMAERVLPETYPSHINQGDPLADTVLEIPGGRAQVFGIIPGSIIRY